MKLNPQQKAAVESDAARIAVVAGAGSGKTATIVARYAHMLKRVKPEQVVIVTFTVRAASELKRRIEVGMLPEPGYVGTIHGWCAKFLPSDVGVASEQVAKLLEERACDLIPGEAFPKPAEIASGEAASMRAYQFYKTLLRRSQLVDYDMLLEDALERCQANPGDIANLHLIVDEYQDTGSMERAIYALFGTVFAVGDPRQTLYSWRGAAHWSADDLADARWKVFYLSQSYRVPAAIADYVNRIQFAGMPAMESAVPGGEFTIGPVETWIERCELLSGAILCRSNREVEAISKTLRDKGWPVRTPESPPTEFEQYRDYLAAILNPGNDAIVETFLRRWHPRFDEIKDQAGRAMVGVSSIASIGEPMQALIEEPSVAEMIALYPDPEERLMAMHAKRYSIHEGPGFIVSTVHQAKGLEWDSVCFVLPQWFENSEDNRRILYVATTRAKARLNIDVSRMKVAPKWLGL